MDFLWSLFSPRNRYRHYARLNQHGVCLAFKHCTAKPLGNDWVEIREPALSWLDNPLPANARVSTPMHAVGARQLLSI